jgi:hypothetical protein
MQAVVFGYVAQLGAALGRALAWASPGSSYVFVPHGKLAPWSAPLYPAVVLSPPGTVVVGAWLLQMEIAGDGEDALRAAVLAAGGRPVHGAAGRAALGGLEDVVGDRGSARSR